MDQTYLAELDIPAVIRVALADRGVFTMNDWAMWHQDGGKEADLPNVVEADIKAFMYATWPWMQERFAEFWRQRGGKPGDKKDSCCPKCGSCHFIDGGQSKGCLECGHTW